MSVEDGLFRRDHPNPDDQPFRSDGAAFERANGAVESGRHTPDGRSTPELRAIDDDLLPPARNTLGELGLNHNNLTKLVLKILYVRGCETAKEVSEVSRLHIAVSKELLEEAKLQGLVEIRGSVDQGDYQDFRHALTRMGREWAADALSLNQYVGPAQIPLSDYYDQIKRQSVTNVSIDRAALRKQFSHLVVPDGLDARLGPAVNSARSILLYGAPGNGKTTIAEAISRAFGGRVHIPYAIEVEGEIIKIFDPIYHRKLKDRPSEDDGLQGGIKRPEFTDRRWIACSRPIITVGGELTLEMLDLHYSPITRFYEAPLHMKSNGGVFIVDDLGRQLVNPKDLLNRWIIPMEKKIDFMSLQNGTTFSLPFDNLLIFSTNLKPSDLMDPAFLRRIPYKVEMCYPTEQQFRDAFVPLCQEYDLEANHDIISFAIHEIQTTHEQPLCFYQPKFILDHVIASSKFEGVTPELNRDLVARAIENISAKVSDEIH